jgi:hypothetical protein
VQAWRTALLLSELVVVLRKAREPRRRADGVVPPEIGEMQLRPRLIERLQLILRHALSNQRSHPLVHRLEAGAVRPRVVFRHELPVAGNQRVEVEREETIDCRDEFERAAATGVVDDRHRVDDEIAGVNRLEVGEVDDGVAVRVPAAEPEQLHLRASEMNGGLVRERHGRLARLLDAQEVRADVLVREDADAEHVAHVGVAAGVVAVMMRVEDVFHRQRADGLHVCEHVGCLAGELVVHDDQTFRGHADRDVA